MHRLVTVLVLALALAAACKPGLYAGQDRPDDERVLGPAAPTTFGCERGLRRVRDTDGDGKGDAVFHLLDGVEICRGEDTNRDGRVDRWQRLEGGRVVTEQRDVDFDGDLDVEAHDTDGDGSLDRVRPVDDGDPGDAGAR